VLNKIEEAADKFNIEDVNIRECIKEIENDLAFKFEEKKINFTADIDNSLVIKGSNFLIYSLFKNLIDNSLEHAGENISINISYKGTKEGKVHFEYFDTGKGVSEKHIERIFERFYRVEEGRTRKSGGSGLGLSIVKNSVSLHKGTISVKNREGGGLLFTLTLSSEL
jgi:two-component system OmpR family sensor kinase/two-component system phosphate regulon sensor histidine kinase PhoR